MNITRPEQKFDVPLKTLGIAMESYAGGRSEARLRLEELPIVPVDFTSEYPTTCVLLNLWEVLIAESLSFDDATEEVRRLLARITHEDCFKPESWHDFRFFALVTPNDEILPVRTVYSGRTMNIGNNYLTSAKSIWIAGPDLIASSILTGKVPQVERAVRVVPHGKQPEMNSVTRDLHFITCSCYRREPQLGTAITGRGKTASDGNQGDYYFRFHFHLTRP